jgi:hypothetical protein
MRNFHTRRKQRTAKAKLNHGEKAARKHARLSGRTGGIHSKRVATRRAK